MEKKTTKTIYIKYEISKCKDCPFYNSGYYSNSAGFCAKKNAYTTGGTLPEKCPLIDGQYYK